MASWGGAGKRVLDYDSRHIFSTIRVVSGGRARVNSDWVVWGITQIKGDVIWSGVKQ